MNDDDFKKLMQAQGIAPQKKSERIFGEKTKPKAKVCVVQQDHDVDMPALSDFIAQPMNAEDTVSFYRPGMQKRVLKQLKAGEITPEDTIDLHGFTIDQARTALLRFLQQSQTEGIRCIRVIHGKGQRVEGFPILKNQVNVWLRQLEPVMAFCSAPRQDGGSGSLYVILSKAP